MEILDVIALLIDFFTDKKARRVYLITFGVLAAIFAVWLWLAG